MGQAKQAKIGGRVIIRLFKLGGVYHAVIQCRNGRIIHEEFDTVKAARMFLMQFEGYDDQDIEVERV